LASNSIFVGAWGGGGGGSSLVFMTRITRKAATLVTSIVDLKQWRIMFGAVTKRRGPGISPGYYEHGPPLLSKENKRKLDPTETPSRLIPRLLVVFTPAT